MSYGPVMADPGMDILAGIRGSGGGRSQTACTEMEGSTRVEGEMIRFFPSRLIYCAWAELASILLEFGAQRSRNWGNAS